MGITDLSFEISSEDSYIRIERSKGKVRGNYKFFRFMEGESHIIYAPEVNLSAYGNDLKDAMEMFQEVVNDFHLSLVELTDAGVEQVLAKLGWERQKFARKNFGYSGAFIDAQGVLKEFDLPEETQIEESKILV